MARPVLAIVGIALIGVGATMAVGFFWDSHSEAAAQVVQQVRSVKIETVSGSVDLRVGDVQATTVHQRFSYHWNTPGESYRLDGDQLVLSDCGRLCSVDYDVVVPKGTTVSGNANSGDITIDGVASANVSAASGTVTIHNVAGPVTAETESGDVIGDGLRGKVDAQVRSGTVKLSLDVAQDVRANASSGNVDVTVPKDSYRVEGNTDSGNRNIGINADSSASRTLDLTTNSGDVTVRGA
jgi:DUF4097 and DUF4098 domain-containing protein YvlB